MSLLDKLPAAVAGDDVAFAAYNVAKHQVRRSEWLQKARRYRAAGGRDTAAMVVRYARESHRAMQRAAADLRELRAMQQAAT